MRHASKILATLTSVLIFAGCAHTDSAAHTHTAERVFLEKMGEGKFDKLDEIYGPGFVAHGASRDYTLEEDNESGKTWRAAFPDVKVKIERTVANDDLVAVHWSASGTNTVAAGGMPGTGQESERRRHDVLPLRRRSHRRRVEHHRYRCTQQAAHAGRTMI